MGFRGFKVAVGVILGVGSGPACTQSPFAVKIEGMGVLERLRPSLFTKAAGCIVCHSNISSPLITTFAQGEPHFAGNLTGGLGTPIVGNANYPIDQNGNWGPAWQTLNISGKVIIPRVTLNATEHQTVLAAAYPNSTPPSEISLKDLLSKTPYESTAFLDIYGSGGVALPAVSTPEPMIPADKILEASKIVIRIPNEQQIAQLNLPAPLLSTPSNTTGFSMVTVASPELAPEDRTITIARGDIYCNGAIKVETPLVLTGIDRGAEGENVIKVFTGRSGCTIYSKRSIFISGTLKIADRSRGGFLALTSGRAIHWGFDILRLWDRFFNTNNPRTYLWDLAYTSIAPARTPDCSNPSIPCPRAGANRALPMYHLLADGLPVKIHDDAEVAAGRPRVLRPACSGPVSNTAVNPCVERKEASIQDVALLAPEIHFAYGGTFSGVMGAEIIAASGGQLNFSFAERFADRKFRLFPELIPILGGEILEVEE